MHPAELPSSFPAGGALPDDLIAKELRTEDGVEQQLEVVARSRIAVEIERSRWLHNSTEFHESRCHHAEVGHHVTMAEEGHKGPHHVGDSSASLDDFFICGRRALIPSPAILESLDLGGGPGPVLGEEHVVVLVALERRSR